jgi:hypothetical protein
MSIVLALLLGCGRPPGIAGCASLDGTTKEDCRFDEAKKLVANKAEFTAAVATIEDPTARDLLLVRLAFEVPSSSATLCSQVTTAIGKQRCQQIIGRPHLRGGK